MCAEKGGGRGCGMDAAERETISHSRVQQRKEEEEEVWSRRVGGGGRWEGLQSRLAG